MAAFGLAHCAESTTSSSMLQPDAAPAPMDAESAPDAAGPTDTGAHVADAAGLADAGPVEWATGGTSALAASYPSPFLELGAACALTCRQTLGPCYVAASTRQDISEGSGGLPMRLLIRVVRADGCTPVTGASVDVWHTDLTGVYSGPTASNICNPSARDVSQETFFRGVQVTNDDGIAAFDTILPGWYPSRTPHVHFIIRTGATEWVTSQLYFDDALTEEIYRIHPEYVARGPAPVNNTNDGLIADGPVADWQQMPDGVLLCSSTLVIRNDIGEAAC